MSNKNQYVFYSINELIEELDKSTPIKGREKSSNKESDEDWADTESYNEAREFILTGKEYDEINESYEKYRTKGTAMKRVNQLSVAGHQVVVPMYLQGIPNSMITSKKIINNKIVTIFYSCQAPWYVKSSDIMETTTTLLKNIISLEQEGYRVNLYVLEVNKNDNGKWGYALKIKTDRERLNVKKMGFPLVSPSFLRRIGFRIKENLYKDWIGDGYGNGVFDYDTHDKFIKKHFGNIKYEIWNHEGKQERRK